MLDKLNRKITLRVEWQSALLYSVRVVSSGYSTKSVKNLDFSASMGRVFLQSDYGLSLRTTQRVGRAVSLSPIPSTACGDRVIRCHLSGLISPDGLRVRIREHGVFEFVSVSKILQHFF